MKHPKCVALVFVLVLATLFEGTAFSLDKEKEFKEIGKMDLKELAIRANAALEKKYPGENWEKYNFPKFVYISEPVQTAYKIAVKRPELLAKFPCYCFCEQMGHKNLSYCFLKNGVVEGKFDDHASGCNICVAQAMTAFLWEEIGVGEAEMQKSMREIFGK